jgi:hypothetical protein
VGQRNKKKLEAIIAVLLEAKLAKFGEYFAPNICTTV